MNGILITFQVLGIALVLVGVLCLFVAVYAIVAYRLSVTRAYRQEKRKTAQLFATVERCRRDFA